MVKLNVKTYIKNTNLARNLVKRKHITDFQIEFFFENETSRENNFIVQFLFILLHRCRTSYIPLFKYLPFFSD